MYDYEYSSAYIDKLLDKTFIKTPGRIFEEEFEVEKGIISLWNRWLFPLSISPNNLALISARKVMDGEPHKPSSSLLKYGMDAITLKLRLAEDSADAFSALSDFVKALLLAFRFAEANERAVESTFFTYIIANRKFSTLKDIIVIIGFVIFGVLQLFVN